jgi:hypothetical protein
MDNTNNENLQNSIKTKIDKINSLQMEILNLNIDSKTEVDNYLSQFKNEINDNLLEYKRIINQELVSIKNDIKILDKKNEMYDLNNNTNNNTSNDINNLNIKINALNTKLNDISERINYNSISKFIDDKFVIFQTQYNIHLNNKINELTPQFDKLVYNNNNIYENLSRINQNINELRGINDDIYDNINKINENSLQKNNELDKKMIEIEKNLEKNLENKLVTIDLTNTETITKFDEDIKIQKSCFTFPNIF